MANAHKNVDLFKALKGGGPNFGMFLFREYFSV